MEWIMAEAAPDARGAFSFAVSRYVLQIVSLYIVFDDNFPIIHKRAYLLFPGAGSKARTPPALETRPFCADA